MEIRLTLLEEKKIVKELFIKEWNSDIMISKNQKHFVENLESIIAVVDKEIIGLLTFNIINKQAEIVSLDSFNIGKKHKENYHSNEKVKYRKSQFK